MNNKFIVVEGLDGSGKTTAVSTIVKYLNTQYSISNILATHEPGGTLVSDVLRVLIKYSIMNEPISDTSELLMMYAARFQLIERVIKPALSKGFWVIADRYDLSSQAYQGGGERFDMLLLSILSDRVMSILSPDLIVYLNIDPKVSISRIKARGIIQDRIEQKSLFFFNQVHIRYQQLVDSQRNVVVIDANQSLDKVTVAICKCLDDWLLDGQE